MAPNTLLFASGDLFFPKEVLDFLEQYLIGDDKSVFYVSLWTILHFISGIITGYILIRTQTKFYYSTGFVIHSLWELWQILVKNTKYWTLRGKVDIGVDTVSFMLGMWVYSLFQ